jgi:hypothetical protein
VNLFLNSEIMENDANSSSDYSETEEVEENVHGGPFRDDPVWNSALASACDVQGSLGKMQY